ncbi:MAG: DUF4833 domain-containing protein [Bacteroidales bacterium]
MYKFKLYKSIIWLLLIASVVPQRLEGAFPADTDKPEASHRLFVIARSKNANLICYDLNYVATGRIDLEKPIHVYWLNQTDKPGTTDELSYMQEKLAYGYTSRPMGANRWEVSLVAFPQRKLFIEKSNEGEFYGRITIAGRQAILKKIYVQADPDNSLKVRWVEVSGIDLETGKEVKERIKP